MPRYKAIFLDRVTTKLEYSLIIQNMDVKTKTTRQQHETSTKSTSLNIQNPGPGAYNQPQLGKNDYITSKYRNYTNGKISGSPGMTTAGRISLSKTIDVSPASYVIGI